MFSGVMQLSVQTPTEVPAGILPMSVLAGGNNSQIGTTVTVQHCLPSLAHRSTQDSIRDRLRVRVGAGDNQPGGFAAQRDPEARPSVPTLMRQFSWS